MKQLLWGAVAVAMVTASPSISAAQGSLDHLICYRITDPFKVSATISLATQLQPEFRQANCKLIKPTKFCVPATKHVTQSTTTGPNIVGQSLHDDYICYLIKCDQTTLIPPKLVADQFGQRKQGNYKPFEVCVPARKGAPPCSNVSKKQCGGVCPDDPATGAPRACRLDSTNQQCTCEPEQCGGKPDKAGQCGGDCPTAGQICRPGLDAAGKKACVCQDPPPPPCNLDPATGTCGGTCTDPAAKCILIDTATGPQCTCQPPVDTCARIPGTNQCGGPCPPGLVCTLEPAINDCRCEPPPQNCGPNPATGQCGGICPVGSHCQLIANTGVPPACGCGP